jgi:hypothetical protein
MVVSYGTGTMVCGVLSTTETVCEQMLEKKRERRESDRAFRERGDKGLEIDEGTLMGGGDSFRAQWVFLLHHPLPSCAH